MAAGGSDVKTLFIKYLQILCLIESSSFGRNQVVLIEFLTWNVGESRPGERSQIGCAQTTLKGEIQRESNLLLT